MKVLIVCSGNANYISPFVKDQVESINKFDIETSYFFIEGKGILGYIKNLPRLKRELKRIKPDIIHAHYGLSGMLAVLQRKVPVVITFHGSDVNNKNVRLISKFASRLKLPRCSCTSRDNIIFLLTNRWRVAQ